MKRVRNKRLLFKCCSTLDLDPAGAKNLIGDIFGSDQAKAEIFDSYNFEILAESVKPLRAISVRIYNGWTKQEGNCYIDLSAISEEEDEDLSIKIEEFFDHCAKILDPRKKSLKEEDFCIANYDIQW